MLRAVPPGVGVLRLEIKGAPAAPFEFCRSPRTTPRRRGCSNRNARPELPPQHLLQQQRASSDRLLLIPAQGVQAPRSARRQNQSELCSRDPPRRRRHQFRLNLNRSENAMNEAQHSPTIGRLIGFLAFLGLALLPSLTSAEPLTQCKRGLRVLDSLGDPIGQVIGDRDGSCLVKSRDGRLQRWVPVGELSAAPPEEPIGSKKTSEPELSEEEPAPPQSDEMDRADIQSEWLLGFPTTRFHGRPLAAKRPALRRGQSRQSRKNLVPIAPATRPAPTVQAAQPRGMGSLRTSSRMGFR
jgi:hypothetical protein